MELTPEEATRMLNKRLDENPEMRQVFSQEGFETKLKSILELEEVDQSLLPIIAHELLVVLAFYAPISDLGRNITETTGISIESSENIAILIEALLLTDVIDTLNAYEQQLRIEVAKEMNKNEIKSTSKENMLNSEARPLTREELMQRLTPRRTMADDVAISQHNPPQTPVPKPQAQGYEAYQNTQTQGH